MKSYAYIYILNKKCNDHNICEALTKGSKWYKVQIDGGHIFSFWWFDLIDNHENKEHLKNSFIISGISHGDDYYLSMNLSNLLANTFIKDKRYLIRQPIEDLPYSFNEIDIPDSSFYEKIWSFLKNNYFKNRILFIGRSDLFNIIPHLLHIKNRSNIYEPFKISKDITDFFNYFKIGPIEKTIIVHSDNLKKIEKDNLKICNDNGFHIINVSDFEEEYDKFNTNIKNACEYYDSEEKRKVSSILNKYKDLFT